MSEHAQALDSGLSGLADFLADTSEETPAEEETEAELTADDSTAEGDTEEEANAAEDESESDEESEEEENARPPSERKIAVPIKAEDGTETTVEIDETELVKGYQRQADYTRKTQELAQRETQAVEFLKSKHDEIRSQYMQQVETARLAVAQMAGIKTEAQLAELAQQDPAAWVAEVQRQKQIGAFLQGLDQQLAGERQRMEQEAQQRQQMTIKQQFERTWQELQKEKIDKPALAKIYEGVNKTYGFTPEELANVYDHRLVKLFRDATAYQQLKAQKPEVTKKVTEAPKLPAKQAPSANEVRQRKALDQRFSSGRAKLNDLAAYLR
jgi:hypothetical protein